MIRFIKTANIVEAQKYKIEYNNTSYLKPGNIQRSPSNIPLKFEQTKVIYEQLVISGNTHLHHLLDNSNERCSNFSYHVEFKYEEIARTEERFQLFSK